MVNMRQRHLTILEFQEGGSDDEIISYIQNNMDFMKNHCLAFHKNISQHVGDFLKLSGIDYFCVANKDIFRRKKSPKTLESNLSDSPIKSSGKKITITLDSTTETPVIKESVISDSNDSSEEKPHTEPSSDIRYGNEVLRFSSLPMVVFKRKIRSGEELDLQSDATFLRDISSGASIKVLGNVHVYSKCQGNLESLGDYIIIKDAFSGRISLKGIVLERELLKEINDRERLKMLTIENQKFKITEV